MPNLNVGFFAACFFMLCGSAVADYIDIFKTGEGYTLVTNNGDIAAKASNLETAQRYADLYTKRGAEVRWQSSLPARTTSGTVNPSAATTTGTSLTTTAKPGTNLPATTAKPGTNLPATTTGGGSNVPATTSGGSGGGNNDEPQVVGGYRYEGPVGGGSGGGSGINTMETGLDSNPHMY